MLRLKKIGDNRFLALLLTVGMLCFGSCKKTTENEPNNIAETTSPKVTLQNGMLRFESIGDLMKAQYLLNPGSNNDFKLPDNFESLESLYSKVVLAENAHQDAYLEVSESQRINYPVHTETYYDALRRKAIYEFEETYAGETYTTYAPNCYSYGLTKLLNTQSLVMVNDTIVQFNHDNAKFIIDGSFSKIELLPITNTTDSQNGILVFPLQTNNKVVQERTIPDFFIEDQFDNGATHSIKWTRKILTSLSHTTSTSIFLNAWVIDFETNVRAERKNTFGGGWSPFSGTLQIVASSTSEVGNSSVNSGQIQNTSSLSVFMKPHGAWNFTNYPSGAPDLLSAIVTGTLWTTNPAISCTSSY